MSQPLTAQAMTFDANRPVTWNQGTAPYAGNSFAYCSEGTFGPCSCGIHSIAYVLLKSEYWEMGKLPTDAYALSQEFGIGSNYQGIPSYNWERVTSATDGYVTHVRSHWVQNNTTSHDLIRQEYAKGNYMVLSVKVGGTGHLIAVDYVDEEGNIVILDSAINAKYLTQMDGNGWVRDIQVFSVDEIPANEAAKYWDGDAVGKVGREREIKELNEQLKVLEGDLKAAEEQKQQQEAKSVEAKTNLLGVIDSLKEQKETDIQQDIETLIIKPATEQQESVELESIDSTN